MDFSNDLTQWYHKNKRDLPWRNTTNPYFIWLSEIMLQQTRVAQGLPYFQSFTENFPTVFDLANASEQEVLKLWQGLGYYSRARNLHATAKHIAFELNGVFPENYKDLLTLKGVGEYTAAAIASFSFNENVAVVDGNVFRVLSRIFDIQTDISLASAKKEFQNLASELIPNGEAAIFNQAIMEFGALQCVPQSPDCENCVMNTRCLALKMEKVASLPVKTKKTKVRNRYFNYLILEDEDSKTIINQRTHKGIWHKLYEFPLIETELEENFNQLTPKIKAYPLIENKEFTIVEPNNESQIHKLSHQHLHIKFWKIKIKGTIENGINYSELKSFPFPIVIHNFIENDLLD
ncbi:MAG: A/G-specific adenine glycosylase [Flavobacterium sp.]